MPIDILQPEQQLSSEQKSIDTTSSPDIGNTNVSGLPLSNPELQSDGLSKDSWVIRFLKKVFPSSFRKVYFEGRFISERKYISILSKRYGNMLKRTPPGTVYLTWE